MKEGDNQRDQVRVWASLTQGSCAPLKLRWTAAVKQSETIEHLPKVSAQPYTLSLRFSPSWLPLSLPIPTPRRGVGGTRKTVWTLYILSIQGRLTLHVRRLVHISQVSSVFLKSQYQSSCTDALTKLLMPCRYWNCFRRCWWCVSQYSYNNNRFFDRLNRRAKHGGS